MFIELHIIQNFPPSNLNRDDVGQPKDTDFGGFRRARISSQCLKRATRYAGKDPQDHAAQSVFERYTGVPLSDRTKLIIPELVKRLTEKHPEQEASARKIATAFAEAYAGGLDEKGNTNVLLFLSDEEQNQIANQLNESWDALVATMSSETLLDHIAQEFIQKIGQRSNEPAKDKAIRTKDMGKEIQSRLEAKGKDGKEIKAIVSDFKKAIKLDVATLSVDDIDWVSAEIDRQWKQIQDQRKAESPLVPVVEDFIKENKGRTSAPDIALFGRMLADKPVTNIDAACQVAHAISTHAVSRNDIDYFTAMDELKPKEESGAGFLDVAYFNSACFYRYARIDFEQLKKNLGGDADLACRSVEAFLRASEAAIPGGKKNSHAQECRPSFMLAVLRAPHSEGWSLVNAFETPVRGLAIQKDGLVAASVSALCDEFDDHCERYGAKSIVAKSLLAHGKLVRNEEAIHGRLAKAVAQSPSDEKSALDVMIETICEPLKKGAQA
jgi:CRISPR system Cascade subunit CasC